MGKPKEPAGQPLPAGLTRAATTTILDHRHLRRGRNRSRATVHQPMPGYLRPARRDGGQRPASQHFFGTRVTRARDECWPDHYRALKTGVQYLRAIKGGSNKLRALRARMLDAGPVERGPFEVGPLKFGFDDAVVGSGSSPALGQRRIAETAKQCAQQDRQQEARFLHRQPC